MLNKYFFSVVLLLILSFPAKTQVIVNTAVLPGDTITAAIKTFFEELSGAGLGKYSVASPGVYSTTGVWIVTASQAEKLRIKYPGKLKSSGPEGIYIKATDKSLLLIGNTALALQEAVYLYLEKLGFRYLVPGKIWEEIPVLNRVYKKMEILTRPDYDNRTIANGHGYADSKKIENDFLRWEKANRMGGSFAVRNGHSYDEVVANNAEVFKQHPEYFAQSVVKGTLPEIPKFNVANKDLVELFAIDAVKRMDNYKTWGWNTLMVSTEPSDGSGFCTSQACMAIGGPSEQAFYLTNMAAKELRKKYPQSWVGSYAYNEHIIPPKFNIEPNVFIMITNGFNRSKYSTEELLSMWGKKVKKTGVYEYLNVYEGSMDMPGQMNIMNTQYLSSSIKKFYKAGATTYVGESTMGWVSKAVGNYVLARLLWDVNADIESIKKDFYQSAFGIVASQMRKMMDSWEQYPHRVPADNDLADWLQLTNEAYKKAGNEKIKERINQVKEYLHYMVLYRNLKKSATKENYLQLMSFAYRNFESAAFATLPTMVSVGNYTGFKGMGWYDAGEKPWKKDNRPFSAQELEQAFQQDIRNIKKTEPLTSFEKTNNFIKLSEVIPLPAKNYVQNSISTWGNTEYIIQITQKTTENYIDLISGYAANPAVDRNVQVMVFKINEGNSNPLLKLEQSKKTTQERFTLGSLSPGTYRLRVEDQNKLFVLKFSPAINYSIVINPAEKLLTTTVAGYNIFYFYVPPGVKNFLLSKTVSLKIETATGRIIDKENGAEETITIDVQPGEQGVWKIFQQSGLLYLEGVPPYLGTHPSTMLLPSYLKK